MSAKIISVVNQKGGAGKTTVTMQIAGTLAKRGHKVAVVDGDPQGSAVSWAGASDDDTQFPAVVMNLSQFGNKIHQPIKQLEADYEFIVVDCPPSVDSVIPKTVLLISNLAVIPVIPNSLDYLATMKAKELVDQIQVLNQELIAKILVNQLQNTNYSKSLFESISDIGIETFKATLGYRIAYKVSSMGKTVHDLPGSQEAKDEVNALVDEILTILK